MSQRFPIRPCSTSAPCTLRGQNLVFSLSAISHTSALFAVCSRSRFKSETFKEKKPLLLGNSGIYIYIYIYLYAYGVFDTTLLLILFLHDHILECFIPLTPQSFGKDANITFVIHSQLQSTWWNVWKTSAAVTSVPPLSRTRSHKARPAPVSNMGDNLLVLETPSVYVNQTPHRTSVCVKY